MPDLLLFNEIANKLTYQSVIQLKSSYQNYLSKNPFPAIKSNDHSEVLKNLKRDGYSIGPYTDITIFEAANRIASDLTLIEGVLQLFEQKLIPETSEVQFRLGTMQEDNKGDFSVFVDRIETQGEAFDVAPSFFKSKLYTTLSKWKKNKSLKYIVFNADCLKDSSCKTYLENQKKKNTGIIFLGVKSWHK